MGRHGNGAWTVFVTERKPFAPGRLNAKLGRLKAETPRTKDAHDSITESPPASYSAHAEDEEWHPCMLPSGD
jgi:hypothetical protein